MDGYSEYPSEFDLASSAESAAPQDVAAAIGTDERRLHVRAYNYWVSLLEGRDFPSIEDLEPADLEDFSSHSVLLDFTCGLDNPAIPYVGVEIRDECGIGDDVRAISDVPSRSLLSRLTDHYMQIIANRSPVGFEAEFENPRGETLCYRGILMPFSSDGDTIDFIYGVINWKHADGAAAEPMPAAQQSLEPAEVAEDVVEDAAPEPIADIYELTEIFEEAPAFESPVLEETILGLSDAASAEGDEDFAPTALDPDAGLADRLCVARETADSVKAGEGRTRSALYKALSLAYDFALAAAASPEEYAELLEDSGMKAQARAPMTPIVKLVFGIDYDKARLTEFAAALSFAERQSLAAGEFESLIAKQAGGLKALVAAERQARRPTAKPDTKTDAARQRLRSAPVLSLADLDGEEEFALAVVRRNADGGYEAVALVADEALTARAIRRAD
jgi:hypothetical protein